VVDVDVEAVVAAGEALDSVDEAAAGAVVVVDGFDDLSALRLSVL
jgi:hypothetical protein